MATDTTVTVVSTDHDEPVEKVNEEIEMRKQEDIPPSKDSEEKDETEKAKAENSSDMEIAITKLEETPSSKETEHPKVLEVEKVDDAAVKDVPVEASSKAVEISVPEHEASSTLDSTGEDADKQVIKTVEKVPEDTPATDTIEKVSEEKSATDAIEKVPEEKPTTDTVQKVQEEKPATEAFEKVPEEKQLEPVEKVPEEKQLEPVENAPEGKPAVEKAENETEDIPSTGVVENEPLEQPATEPVENQPVEKQETLEPNLLSEAADQSVEHLEVFPARGPQAETMDQPKKISEAEFKTVEKLESVNDVENKPEEQSQIVEVAEKNEDKHNENVEGEIMKGEEIEADECNGSVSLKEEEITAAKEPVAIESPVSANEEAHAVQKEVEKDSLLSDVKELIAEDINKIASTVDMTEGTLKEETLVVGKVEEEQKQQDVKVKEESEGKNLKIEEPNQGETTKTEDVSRLNGVEEVAKEASEAEQGTRDLEQVKEKEENVKEDIATLVETKKVNDAEGKVTEASADDSLREPKDSQLNVKEQDTVKAESAKAVVDETKSDPPIQESSKDGDDTKTSRDLPVQEVSVKPSQKSSGNIISKVKQSIVKVKKAIIGKSPNSKTLKTEVKGDEKAR